MDNKGHIGTEASSEINDFLDKIGQEDPEKKEEIIYGVYDNRHSSLFTRIDDFFIDRSVVPLKEKAYFFHLMSVMLDAGLSVVQVLKILSRRTTNLHFRRVISTLSHSVERGKALSDAMEQFPVVFSEAEIGIVRSGEAVGHLDKMLARLSAQLERSYDLSLKVKTAMVYPITVLIALVIAGGVLTFFVVPQLSSFFEQSGIALPTATKVFIAVSSFFFTYWWLFVSLILGLFVFLNVYRGTEKGALKFDYYLLKFPIAGDLLKKLLLARFVSMLEILISSGLPIIRTMEIIAEAIGNEVYRRKLYLVSQKLEQGNRLSPSLRDAPFLFPETLVQMLNVGEQSAALDRAAEKLGLHYFQESEHAITRLTTAFGPIVIVLIGLMVALVAFAILGPIFSLSDITVAS